jgi:hypothetical protein
VYRAIPAKILLSAGHFTETFKSVIPEFYVVKEYKQGYEDQVGRPILTCLELDSTLPPGRTELYITLYILLLNILTYYYTYYTFRFKIMWPDGKPADLQMLMGLKGTKRSDQQVKTHFILHT